MTSQLILKDTREKMEKSLTHLVDQLRQIRTSRASPALVEGIRVDYYGTPSPISQVAQISVPEPRQLAIKPFDAAMLKEIEKAIQKSDLGVTPQSDGKILRLTMPPLSGDQRKKYAARVKDLAEEARVSMRNPRRDENKRADALFKDSKMTEDEHKKCLEDIQKCLKEYEDKVTGALDKKTAEVMEN